MISTSDRQDAVQLIDEARVGGARLQAACVELGIGTNTYRRWARGNQDRRPAAERPVPGHALTPAERQRVLEICHRPAFASLPPGQIVPRRLDEEGLYLASESSYYRILRAHDEQHPRGRARTPRPKGDPQRHRVTRPNACWTWDVTYLPGLVRGQFDYLYMIVDAEVFDQESMANSSEVIQRAVLREGCMNKPLVLHNGSAMKGSTLQATLQRLNITPSHSRPRVSNDNAFSESLFRTCKYRPNYPVDGYDDLAAAQRWVAGFVQWYNHEHRHSAIRFVTPAERHAGQDEAVLAKRDAIYAEAKRRHPGRWSGTTRNGAPRRTAWLNPDQEDPLFMQDQRLDAA
jgi:transposase InsO family protein